MSSEGALAILGLLFVVGCQPLFDRPASLVADVRLLAVRAEPAEGPPGSVVRVDALLAGPNGTITTPVLDWAFCMKPHSPAENATVAQACLALTADFILPVAIGAASVTTQLPAAACTLFGPEPPPPAPGEPPLRPADPDATGGYYQPLRVVPPAGTATAFGRLRMSCALPSAPVDVARDYRERYTSNRNPTLTSFATVAGTTRVVPGQTLRLKAEFLAVDRESFVVYDSERLALEAHVEALEVSWFATAGKFASETSSPASDALSAEVEWTAGPESGSTHFWAVLRDDRGGITWRELEVENRGP